MVEFPSERELLFLVIGYYLFQEGSTLVVEFPSERELLFLVNWFLFVYSGIPKWNPVFLP